MWSHAIDLVYLGLELVDNHVLHDVKVDQPDLNLAAINVSPDDHRREVSLVLPGGELVLVLHIGAISLIRCDLCSRAVIAVWISVLNTSIIRLSSMSVSANLAWLSWLPVSTSITTAESTILFPLKVPSVVLYSTIDTVQYIGLPGPSRPFLLAPCRLFHF